MITITDIFKAYFQHTCMHKLDMLIQLYLICSTLCPENSSKIALKYKDASCFLKGNDSQVSLIG